MNAFPNGRGRRVAVALLLLSATVLPGCSLVPAQPPQASSYDLGDSGDGATDAAPLVRLSCVAPSWLDGAAMYYRLQWRDPLQLQAYRDSRWLAPPCALLVQRLRSTLANDSPAGAGGLALELDAFEQDFTAADASTVLIRVHATWSTPGGQATARSRMFEIRHAAAQADAAGGAAALAAASRELQAALHAWTTQP